MLLKELTEANKLHDEQANINRRTTIQKVHVVPKDREEMIYLINQILVQDSSFNFPKIYLILHWAEQIFQYGSLPQFLMEICEISHKAF